MSPASALVTHLPSRTWAVAFGALLIVVEVYASYRLFASIVKWLCLSLLAYVAAAFVVGVDWVAALRHTLIPRSGSRGHRLRTRRSLSLKDGLDAKPGSGRPFYGVIVAGIVLGVVPTCFASTRPAHSSGRRW